MIVYYIVVCCLSSCLFVVYFVVNFVYLRGFLVICVLVDDDK